MRGFKDRMTGLRGSIMFIFLLAITCLVAIALVKPADAEIGQPILNLAGTATVEVVTEPELCNGGRLRFTGVPSGEIVLGECKEGEPVPRRTLAAPNLTPGQSVSTLSFIDPSITEAGYSLAAIRCDDADGQSPSTVNLVNKKATFRLDANESVTCKFILSTQPCICPKSGRWSVKNHRGQMACTGAVSLTTPLAPATTNGTIQASDDCSTLYAEGMSDDEAPITFRRTSGCGYKGTVGGQQGGIPMEIHFTLSVENDERLTGALTSTVARQGMTCNMNRTYELDFRGP